jgi:hypothetical protein
MINLSAYICHTACSTAHHHHSVTSFPPAPLATASRSTTALYISQGLYLHDSSSARDGRKEERKKKKERPVVF